MTEERHQPPAWEADCWFLERARWQTWGRKDRQDLHLHIHQMAQRVADELGLSVTEVLLEAQQLLLEVPYAPEIPG